MRQVHAESIHTEADINPPCFIHVDLDGLWTLAGCYGFPEGSSYEEDPVFMTGLPRLLNILDELEIRATFFIVGRDTLHPFKSGLIREIHAAGHEIANHSWSHTVNLESMNPKARDEEIQRTSDAIRELTGDNPRGFRSPGYAAGPRILSSCARTGLAWDGSWLPTKWAPLLRWMAGRYRKKVWNEQNSGKSGHDLNNGFGDQYGRNEAGEPAPALPYRYQTTAGTALDDKPVIKTMTRLPLATSPRLGIPLHASMGMLFGEFITLNGLENLICLGRPVTWLLHGMDCLGIDDIRGRLPSSLTRSRAFNMSWDQKEKFLINLLTTLKCTTRIQLTSEWLESPDARQIPEMGFPK
jgi:hypothetical protein